MAEQQKDKSRDGLAPPTGDPNSRTGPGGPKADKTRDGLGTPTGNPDSRQGPGGPKKP